jgi:chloride channel protein, CIC family
VHLEIFGLVPWHALALLAAGSILATSITLNSGGSGGLFTPSLYIGAAAGGAFGVALNSLFPALGLRPEAYALVGMGAVVAAAAGAPITGILLIFEMTNDYAIVLPLMLTTAVAYLVARRLEADTLYSGWLRRRGERLEHGADRDVLAALIVADAYDRTAETVPAALPVADLIARLVRGDAVDLPVLDADRRLVGLIAVADLGRVAAEHRDLIPTLHAADLAEPVEAVTPTDSLLDAVRRMGVRGMDTVPVVDTANGRFLGLVRRAHVLGLYERHLAGSAGGSTAAGSHAAATESRIP